MVFRAAIELTSSRHAISPLVVLVRAVWHTTTTARREKKTFPLCERHTMLLLLPFASLLAPTSSYRFQIATFFLSKSQKISPNQFADLFIRKFSPFYCIRDVDSLTHTRTYAVATHRRKKMHTEKKNQDTIPIETTSYKERRSSHAHGIFTDRNRSVGCTFARRVNSLFFAAPETDCKKW